jgi:hypothetical protein
LRVRPKAVAASSPDCLRIPPSLPSGRLLVHICSHNALAAYGDQSPNVAASGARDRREGQCMRAPRIAKTHRGGRQVTRHSGPASRDRARSLIAGKRTLGPLPNCGEKFLRFSREAAWAGWSEKGPDICTPSRSKGVPMRPFRCRADAGMRSRRSGVIGYAAVRRATRRALRSSAATSAGTIRVGTRRARRRY